VGAGSFDGAGAGASAAGEGEPCSDIQMILWESGPEWPVIAKRLKTLGIDFKSI
jgi:hypothetical protein